MIKIRKAVEAEFKQQEHYSPRNEKERFLIKSLSSIKNERDMAAFLRDLLTIAEIEEFANRLEIARLIAKGHSYQEVADQTGVSTTTVSRVAHWLFNGCGGYYKALKKKTSR